MIIPLNRSEGKEATIKKNRSDGYGFIPKYTYHLQKIYIYIYMCIYIHIYIYNFLTFSQINLAL